MSKRYSETIEAFGKNAEDTGCTQVQIAILTERINYLNKSHFKDHKHDYATRRGLMQMVGKRARLLKYLKKTSVQEYNTVLEKLGLRK